MTSVYIIWDNQYVAPDAAEMLTHQKALIFSPEAVLNQEITITDYICDIFSGTGCCIVNFSDILSFHTVSSLCLHYHA